MCGQIAAKRSARPAVDLNPAKRKTNSGDIRSSFNARFHWQFWGHNT